MKTLLDASHICLIKQWRTFQKMKRSADEVQQHLTEAALGAIVELKKRYAPDLQSFDREIVKEQWFDIYPRELTSFGEMGIDLVKFGIRHLAVDGLIDPNAECPCIACAYSNDEPNGIWAQVRSFLWELPIPDGFTKYPDEAPYIYTATLPTLKAEDFASPVQLTEALRDPLSKLLEWHKRNADAIRRFQPIRYRRTNDVGAQI